MTKELIRTWNSKPFSLNLYDLFKTDKYGKSVLGYEFYLDGELIFEGNDFHCSPMNAIDSDEIVAALLGFLALRPGDTDKNYFDDYSLKQMQFANDYGELLSCIVYDMENKDC